MLEAVGLDDLSEICWILEEFEAHLLKPKAMVLRGESQDDRHGCHIHKLG